VKEVRFGFSDGNMTDINPNEDLYELARSAHRDWKAGKRVLIRCAAGWNRSGIVMALVLIRDGYSVEDAINLIREKRCPEALCNTTFANWLRTEVHENLHFWRN
jgi:protein-tyrosine phosphatase